MHIWKLGINFWFAITNFSSRKRRIEDGFKDKLTVIEFGIGC
jgi:hypothetical protein